MAPFAPFCQLMPAHTRAGADDALRMGQGRKYLFATFDIIFMPHTPCTLQSLQPISMGFYVEFPFGALDWLAK
jgi:hypothetical protein